MPPDSFTLAERLQADTFPISDLALCRVLIMDEARFPWLILVPRRPGVQEIFDLTAADQRQLMGETAQMARLLKAITACDKINVAALGNSVAQLHMHVIARFKNDAAWPNPVWGCGNSQKLTPAQKNDFISKILEKIPENFA